MTTYTLRDGRTVNVRPAETGDAAALVALIDRCYQERIYYHTSRYDRTPEQQAELFGSEIWFIAADPGGQLVGWCEIAPGRAEFLRHEGGLGIGVDAAYRDAGLGSRLLAEAIAAARAAGLERITLYVNGSNTRAIRAYEKAGFAREGRLVKQIKDGARYDDVVIMGLLFNETEEV